MADFFVSHTLADSDYCRKYVLPAVKKVSQRTYYQCVFMDFSNFGNRTEGDGFPAGRFAQAYAQEIERLLNESYRLVLVGSVAATQSEWVKREVCWWAENRGRDGLLVVQREPCLITTLHPVLQEDVPTLLLNEAADPDNAKLLVEALAVCLND